MSDAQCPFRTCTSLDRIIPENESEVPGSDVAADIVVSVVVYGLCVSSSGT